jgi:hypothetical protein
MISVRARLISVRGIVAARGFSPEQSWRCKNGSSIFFTPKK